MAITAPGARSVTTAIATKVGVGGRPGSDYSGAHVNPWHERPWRVAGRSGEHFGCAVTQPIVGTPAKPPRSLRPPRCRSPWVAASLSGGPSFDSDHLVFADGHVDFLARLRQFSHPGPDALIRAGRSTCRAPALHRKAARGRRRPRFRAVPATPRSGRPGTAGTGPVIL